MIRVSILLALVFFVVPAWAQEDTPIPRNGMLVQIAVTNRARQPIVGAEVRIDDQRVGETDEAGQFIIPRKPMAPGRHKLTVGLHGYASSISDLVIPTDEGLLPVEIKITLSGQEELPPRRVSKTPNYRVYQLFYATDRKVNKRDDPEEYYGGERAGDEKLELGTVDVSIPAHHTPGVVETPSWIRMEFHFDPEKHVVLEKPQRLAEARFYDKLRVRVGASNRKEAFVFIHGYNTRFAEAAKLAAQLSADLGFDGAPILYSWPSEGRFTGYFADQQSVAWSVPHLKAFLEDVARRSGATRVHLIAHSMGNRAMTAALDEISKETDVAAKPLFDQVVLAAPDLRVTVMQRIGQSLVALAQKVTLYASENDDALLIARLLDGVDRAGQKAREVLIPGIDAVDASAVRTDFIGHGYFADSPSLISDLRLLLMDDADPVHRKLEPVHLASFLYWRIPAAAQAAVGR